MKNLKRIIAMLLICLTVFAFSACSLEFKEPSWIQESLCNHVFGESEVIKEATCGVKGKRKEVCSNCGKTVYYTIKATGEHAFDEGVQEDGVIIYTCNVCGKTKTEEIPACTHVDANNDIICDNCSEDLYIFYDESKYTEVEAVVGETVAGNWYRVYGKQRVVEGQSTIYEAEGFKINPSDHILFGYGIGAHHKGGCYIASSTLSDFDMKTILAVRSGENEIGIYTDFYINLGSCTISIYGTETTIEITEETAISDISNKVYRLEVNKK